MRRILHIALAATLAAICVLPASGQDYRRNKVKADPEPLEFRKVFELKDVEKDKGDIYRDMYGWNPGLYLEFIGSVGFDEKCYFMAVDNLDFGGEIGRMTASVNIHFLYGSLVLELKDLAVGWRNHHVNLSKRDDSFNRTWLWRVNHNPKTVQAARDCCNKIFDDLCSSMDEYLRNGPPMELKPM